MNIAIQGIKGSFHHIASLNYFKKNLLEFTECLSFDEMPKLLLNNKVDYIVMAIENSIAGSILYNYKLIDEYNLNVLGEIYLPINHQLMAIANQDITDIKEVWSHPMAINQCREFLRKHPHIKIIEAEDTAEAAKQIMEKSLKGIAAIASKKAAEIYNLKILAKNIQTNSENFTRFFIINKIKNEATHYNKVSLKIITKHKEGSLLQVLQIFADNKLNLTKLQSLPIINKPWKYAFFIDLIFEDKIHFETAIQLLEKEVNKIKIFGKYLKS